MTEPASGRLTKRMRIAAAWTIVATLASGCALETRPKGAGCDGTAPVCQPPSLRASLDKGRSAPTARPFSDFDKAIEDMLRPDGTRRLKRLGGAPPLHALVLSSGGPWGAFGAGFMKGLSQGASDKLQFAREYDLVTGISTGAVLSTFLFLGRYDEIYQIYVTGSDAMIYKDRPLGYLSALFFNSLSKTDPLRALLESRITDQILDDVANEAEAERRRLFVGAVDLDTGRLAAIDLTAIAMNRSNPRRKADYIDAVLASAAIPVKFNPQFIQRDMYVDGGARSALLFVNRLIVITEQSNTGQTQPRKWTVYLLVNGNENPISCDCTANTAVSILQRTFKVMQDNNDVNNMYRIWREVTSAPRNWLAYHAAPADTTCAAERANMKHSFDNEFMACLGPAGQQLGSSARPWNDDFSSVIGEGAYMQ